MALNPAGTGQGPGGGATVPRGSRGSQRCAVLASDDGMNDLSIHGTADRVGNPSPGRGGQNLERTSQFSTPAASIPG